MPEANPANLPPAATSALDALSKAMGAEYGAQGEIPPAALPTPHGAAAAARMVRHDAPSVATGATGAPPAATGATGAPPAAATGATGAPPAAATGATGAPPAAATGATGAPPAATGETGTSPTQEQLDRAEAGMDLKAGTAFRIVRSDLERTERELAAERQTTAEQAAKIKEISGKVVDETAMAAKDARIAEMEQELAIVRYESTSEFKQLKAGLNQTETSLGAIAAKYNVPERDLSAALAEKDPMKRSDLLGEMTKEFRPYDLVSFDRMVVERDARLTQVSEAIGKASETLRTRAAADAAAAQKQAEALGQSWTQAMTISRATLENEIPLIKVKGDEKWTNDVTAALDRARKLDIVSVPNEDLALRIYKSEMVPLLQKLITSMAADNLALNDRVTKLQGGAPGAGAGTPPAATPVVTGVKQDASFYKTIAERLAETGMPK